MAAQSKRKDSLVMGFALFAMFFGAGNLIFPPYLGLESGTLWPLGLAGFLLTDVVLACVGIYAVNAAGGPVESIDAALGHRPGLVLSGMSVVCLGVLFAMPRTAATTYEMSIVPYLGDNIGLFTFSIVFFVVVFLLAVRPTRIMDIIGKFFTPTLVAGIVLLVAVGIAQPLGLVGEPQSPTVFQDGIRAGYQTMDVLGVVSFSLVLIDSIRAHGYEGKRTQLSIVLVASLVAVGLLGVLYGGLTYLGATAQGMGEGLSQSELIVAMTYQLLGAPGVVILGIVVALACVTTAVALVGSTASYFSKVSGGKLPYRVVLAVDCVIGIAICNLGLAGIISIADPVLGVVCPPLVTVIVLLLFHRRIRRRAIYQGAAIGALVSALVIELQVYGGLPINLEWLPLYDLGFAWVTFAAIGGLVGWLMGKGRDHKPSISPA